MFCAYCGNQLDDGTKFCIYCGKPVEAPPSAPEDISAGTHPGTAPADAAPEAASPAELVVPEPSQPTSETQADLDSAPELPPQPVTVPQDTGSVAQSDSGNPEKKKGSTGGIIAIILVLLLVVGGGLGYYLYSQHAYKENLAAYHAAETLLANKDYEGALAAFRKLEDFEDAEARIVELEKLQEAYDEAVELADAQKFDEAAKAFQELGDYRDSKTFADFELDYRRADALLSGEDVQNAATLADYLEAADIFAALGDYTDAAERASSCWLSAALIGLESGDLDSAMGYLDRLTPADASELEKATGDIFLAALVEALICWKDEDKAYSLVEELELAAGIVEPFSGVSFYEDALADVYDDFYSCLEIMYNALDSEGYVDDYAEYYRGMYYLYELCDELYYDYGVFAEDVTLQDTFVGLSQYPYTYWKAEDSLARWWPNAMADKMDDGRYYTEYTNDSGVNFTLYAKIYFYDKNNNLLETGNWVQIYVANGATVYIPVIPTTIADSQWHYFGMDWDYDYAE